MSINILAKLDELIAETVRFKGAIFLTYSLNLQFFEQLIQPKLDLLGCTRVIIISDIFGYQEALERNLYHAKGVGRRYVCAPLESKGKGVQHSKLLILVSENRGWMLSGSGNLTLSGYGQNLELFDVFHYAKEDTLENSHAYPFQVAWRMISSLQGELPQTGQEQLKHIVNQSPWLNEVSTPPTDFALWYSFDRPLIERLETAYDGNLDELHVFAPFIDIPAVKHLIERFLPSRLIVGVDAVNRNIDGEAVQSICQEVGCEVEFRALQSGIDTTQRSLHAKTIIGVHSQGSWCIVGSANITRPALLDMWIRQGNLETVIFRTSSERDTFHAVWHDANVKYSPLSVQATAVQATEPRKEPDYLTVKLSEVNLRENVLSGQVKFSERLHVHAIKLHTLISRLTITISMDSDNRFSAQLSFPLVGAEAIYLEIICDDGHAIESNKVFIDQPYELAKYGLRSFHGAMNAKIERVRDAAYTLKELMDFLFQRTDREKLNHENLTHERRNKRKSKDSGTGEDEPQQVLPASDFVTDEELTYHLGQRVNQMNPYDRDHYSLRDLLSLALLRITTETSPQRIMDASIDDEGDSSAVNEAIEDAGVQRQEWQQWLVNYLKDYCKKYHQRLLDADFLRKTGQFLLYQNHHTLCRILLEFHGQTEVFDDSLLRQMIHLLWLPFLDPNGFPSVFDGEVVTDDWHVEDLTALFGLMIASAWPQKTMPENMASPMAIRRYLYAKQLLAGSQNILGEQFWLQENYQHSPFASDEIASHITELASFKTPIERKYEKIMRFVELCNIGQANSQDAKDLYRHLLENDNELVRYAGQARAILPLVGDAQECPLTHIALPDNLVRRIRSGELEQSPHRRGVFIYWMPDIDIQNLVL